MPRRVPDRLFRSLSLQGTDYLRVADATCLTVEFVAVRPPPQDGNDDTSDSRHTVYTLNSNDDGSSSYDSDSDSSESGPPAGPPPPRPLTNPGHSHRWVQATTVFAACVAPAAANSPSEAQSFSPVDSCLLLAIINLWVLGSICRSVAGILQLLAVNQLMTLLLAKVRSACSFWGLDSVGAGSVGFEGQNQFPQLLSQP